MHRCEPFVSNSVSSASAHPLLELTHVRRIASAARLTGDLRVVSAPPASWTVSARGRFVRLDADHRTSEANGVLVRAVRRGSFDQLFDPRPNARRPRRADLRPVGRNGDQLIGRGDRHLAPLGPSARRSRLATARGRAQVSSRRRALSAHQSRSSPRSRMYVSAAAACSH